MTKKQLQRYQSLKREQAQISQMLHEIELEMQAPRTSRIDALPHGSPSGGGGPTESLALKHIELREKYRVKELECIAERVRIENAIEALDPVERMLMRYKYIDDLTWEEVAVKMGYSWRHVHRIHAAALKHIGE